MLDKSNRKHENAYNLNATCVDSSRTNAVDNEYHYLMDYAYNMITKQLLLTNHVKLCVLTKLHILYVRLKISMKKPDIYRQDSLDFELSMSLQILTCIVPVDLEAGIKCYVVTFYSLLKNTIR